MVNIEKLDVRTYRVSSEADVYILRPMRSGRHRWGMFRELDCEDDGLVIMEKDTEKQMIAEGVIAALR